MIIKPSIPMNDHGMRSVFYWNTILDFAYWENGIPISLYMDYIVWYNFLVPIYNLIDRPINIIFVAYR